MTIPYDAELLLIGAANIDSGCYAYTWGFLQLGRFTGVRNALSRPVSLTLNESF